MHATLDLKATVLDLERRVAMLETMLHGHTLPAFTEPLLIRMYLDAHRPPPRDPVLARAVTRQLYLLDTRLLLLLGRAVHDPFPWRPFLLLADRCVAKGLEGAVEAREHLFDIIHGLLDLMGLELLEPYDVMGKLRVKEAVELLKR